MSKQIPLTQGYFAIVDDEDFEYLCQWRWHYESGRARSNVNGKMTLLHRFIMNVDDEHEVDHWDLNMLNCQKSNLRPCSRSQNEANKNVSPKNKIGFKGVSQEGRGYRAIIYKDGLQIYIGNFQTPHEAARAYDQKAIEIFGQFARLNFSTDEIQ